MRVLATSYDLAMALTLGLIILMSSSLRVGECLRFRFLGVNLSLDTNLFHSPELGPVVGPLSPSPAPSPAPAPSPGPSSQRTTPFPLAPSPVPTPTSGLQVGFYKGRCSNKFLDVEELIAIKVQAEFVKDPTILPALLRMQFHDCMVHGCDASILVDGPSTEKTAGPNLSVRGFEFIEFLKASVESECPDVVSCADIIAIATNVVMKLGGGPAYAVETGRRDGVISKAADVDLPSPTMTVPESTAAFNAKNFTAQEMVILLGCHAVGISHCTFFQDRLYQGSDEFDPLMDPTLRKQLMPTCPQGTTSNNFTLLNQSPGNNNTVDNSFYNQLLKNRGILPIDQELSRDPTTRGFVVELSLNETLFNITLAKTMVKLQALDVLTGNQGQIRKVCGKIN